MHACFVAVQNIIFILLQDNKLFYLKTRLKLFYLKMMHVFHSKQCDCTMKHMHQMERKKSSYWSTLIENNFCICSSGYICIQQLYLFTSDVWRF